MTEVEHYCLDCTFRPWLDATGDLTAELTVTHANGRMTHEALPARGDGRFGSKTTLRSGDHARIVIRDAWGDTTGNPARMSG